MTRGINQELVLFISTHHAAAYSIESPSGRYDSAASASKVERFELSGHGSPVHPPSSVVADLTSYHILLKVCTVKISFGLLVLLNK